MFLFFFFFKQKTAYEMRISDWSSDVCSSDLFTTAAQLMGASPARIIGRHLLPSFTSHLIASLTVSIPTAIFGETALSFLGIGLRPPITSWGVVLNEAQNFNVVAVYPWLLLPIIPLFLVVLAFNFLGDGLRDAADPYS